MTARLKGRQKKKIEPLNLNMPRVNLSERVGRPDTDPSPDRGSF